MAEKKKETFSQAFKRNRNKFKSSGNANDYTFKHNGKSYNILQKGETKAGVMKKFSAPKTSVRPKLRPAPPISDNTKKKIGETVRKVASPSKPTSKDKDGNADLTAGRQLRPVAAPKRKVVKFKPDGTVKGPGQKARPGARPKPTSKPTRKADGVPARLREKTTDGLPKGIGGMLNRKDEPGAPFLGSKGGKSAALRRKDVKEGQAKYKDRKGPQRRARDVTFAEWKGMSRAKRKMLGLPVSVVGGELGFKRFRKGFTGKDYTAKTKP